MSFQGRRHRFEDRGLQELDEDLNDALEQLQRSPLGLDGVIVEGISFASGTAKTIAHKLGRKPRGWLVVLARDAAPVLHVTSANWAARDERHVTLTPGATFEADVYFF